MREQKNETNNRRNLHGLI